MNIIHNDSIRKLIVAFGNLFSQIPILRYDDNQHEVERFIVSIIYAAKEQYIHRLNDDPELNSRVNIVIPTLSYEMMGMSYDASRKQITNIKNFANTPEGVRSQYMPVPYDFDIDLNLYARTFEDAHQIVEHIVSYFTPDYTIKVNYIPEMNIVKEVPIILNSVDRDVEYEGDRESSTRRIVFTFHFTLKGYIFGKPSDFSNKLILHTISNIYDLITPESVIVFSLLPTSGIGNYIIDELIYQNTNDSATAKVIDYNHTHSLLYVKNVEGVFNPDLPLIGNKSFTTYRFDNVTNTSSNNHKYAIVENDVSQLSTLESNNFTFLTSNNQEIYFPINIFDVPNSINISNNYVITTSIREE